MPLNTNRRPRRPGRRTVTVATSLAAVTLAAGLVTACDDTDTHAERISSIGDSLDCLRDAGSLTGSLKAIHDAGLDAAQDPARTDESIDTIDKNLDKIGGTTDNSKVNKALKDLRDAIADYNKAILNGDTHPDPGAINDAAGALTNVCVS
ncbi:hypothetical protein [Streptomyces paludis]|uniref:Secreted protein n=1 Tax=Streptomyces paludis TaxID=2282738 RepID=A0A345HQY3_9ACTN|nr:hypothetical protein [Streptomyces paludis]AXG79107.1 hypothetical protein DVK44_17055 [Streptomyces paludis]